MKSFCQDCIVAEPLLSQSSFDRYGNVAPGDEYDAADVPGIDEYNPKWWKKDPCWMDHKVCEATTFKSKKMNGNRPIRVVRSWRYLVFRTVQ